MEPKEERYHANHYANEILKHCKRVGIPIDDRDKNGPYKTIRELTGFSRHQLFNNHLGFNQDENQQEVFNRDVVMKFFMACRVHPTTFLRTRVQEDFWFKLEKDKKKTLNKNLYFTNDYWEKLVENGFASANSLIKYIRIKSHDPDYNTELKDVYKNILAPYFRSAEHTIKVYEVLFKGTNREPNEHLAYAKSQHYVLCAIQDWLDSKKAKNKAIAKENKKRKARGEEETPLLSYEYTRTLACSRSTYIFKKDGNENLKQAMVFEASARTLVHLKYCLEEHGNHCNFYVTTTSRLRNHALIDDNYSLTEDYTTSNNIVVPDGIFINDVCPTSKAFPFKTSLDVQTFKGIRFTKANLIKFIIEGWFLADEQADIRLKNAKRIREELGLEDVADEEWDKGEILRKYENTTLKKVTSLEYLEELEREKEKRENC